jgi:hypothetical protein
LHTEEGTGGVTDTLVAAIVGVDKQLLPAILEAGGVHSITVVLRSDVALARDHAGARNVVTAVTELHLAGCSTDGAGNQLVTQTDTEDRCAGILECLGQVIDSGCESSGVTGSVGDKQTIVVLACQGGEVVVPGNNHDLNTTGQQAAELVVFHTNIQAQNADVPSRGVLESNIRGGRVKLGFTDRDCK